MIFGLFVFHSLVAGDNEGGFKRGNFVQVAGFLVLCAYAAAALALASYLLARRDA